MIPAILMIPMSDFNSLQGLSFPFWILLIILGLNTAAAYGSLAEAFKYLEANKVAVILTINPIITIISMYILEDLQVDWIQPEKMTYLGLLGAAFIVSGAVLAIRSPKKKSMAVEKPMYGSNWEEADTPENIKPKAV